MSVVIDATAGGASANSFVLLTEAQTYVDAKYPLPSAWTALVATPDTLNRALVSATTELSMLSWEGRRATTTQAQSWPRWAALNPDSPVGFLYASDVIPDRVKNATCELALQAIIAGTTDFAAIDPNLGVIEKQVDVLVTRWQPYQRKEGLSRFPSVMRFIRPLLQSYGGSVPVVRG